MRAVVFSDIHLHNFRQFNQIDSITSFGSRLIEAKQVLDFIWEYLYKNSIKNLIFCGDLFHDGSSIKPDVLKVALDFLLSCIGRDIDIIAIPGQHDYYTSQINAISSFSELDIHIAIPSFQKGNFIFWGCPNAKNKEEQLRLLQEIIPIEGKRNILLGHFLVKEILEADNANIPTESAVSINDFSSRFHISILGDYHNSVWFGKSHVLSVGATHHHTFASKNRPLGGLIDINLETLDFKRIEIPAPKFIEYAKYSDDLGFKIGNYYRVHVSSKEEIENIKERTPDSSRIEFVIKADATENSGEGRLSLGIDMSPEHILREYAEFINKKEYLEKGLSYL